MFFGIGAYGIAIASTRLGPTWAALAVGAGRVAGRCRWCCRWLIGLFSLRVRAIFFAMITLAVASAFQTLASQLSDFTGGEDGLTFKVPELLSPSFEFLEAPFLGVSRRRPPADLLPAVRRCRWCWCWRCCASSTRRSAACCRRSARTTSAPRPSATAWWSTAPRRACCRRCSPRWPAPCWRSGCATTGRTPRCRFEIMIDVLLIVVIGGMGTMYGAVIGAVLFLIAQSYLQDLLRLASEAATAVPVAVGTALARPLAALAGRAVRAVGVLLPDRGGGAAARQRAPSIAAGRMETRHEFHIPLPDLRWPRNPLHRVGRRPCADRDRLAWPGAHRARHGRTGRRT